MHCSEAAASEEVVMEPRNTVADFNKLAAEAKDSTLLRIMLDGQGMFIVVSPQTGSEQR
jgi:hypothetical protein